VTKRSIVAVSCLSVFVAALQVTSARGDVARPGPARRPTPAGLAVGASFVIEPPMADYVRELDTREQREQVRDWAVLGTLTRMGATVAQVAAATYQTPPGRLPYLDELYAFEYGRGRRAYLNNRVLLFRDRDDPDPQATIGRLADRVRMENGEVPRLVELYVVDDRRNDGMIQVERIADVTRDQLFSTAYGYIEADASTPDELSSWLDRVDDLTFAKLVSHGRLRLGGRRFAATRTASLTANEVASIYQAQKQLDQRRLDALVELAALPPILNNDLARYFGLARSNVPRASALAAFRAFESNLTFLPASQRDRVLQSLGAAFNDSAAPGFSLDPEWLPDPEHPSHPLMLARIRAFAADPCADLLRTSGWGKELAHRQPDESRRTSRTVVAVAVHHLLPPDSVIPVWACTRLHKLVSPALEQLAVQLEDLTPGSWEVGFAAYYRLVQEWEQRPRRGGEDMLAWLAAAALEFHESDTRVQCARYEGLAGTRVGMTLFYTDLLAKLWESTDFGHSAPIAEVPGFVSEPRLQLPSSFLKEALENPYTRLWFGARSNGVSRSGTDREPAFAFDHRFSRLYAAGSNPAKPGTEVQPAERARRALGWWDRHFDDVADYEPEYHRQNQVMKWSLVTATLVGTPLGHALSNLDVFRGYRFAEWQRSHQRVLRFAEGLPQVAQGIAGKECIPVLSSYGFEGYVDGAARDDNGVLAGERHSSWVISGGVTALGRAAPRAVPVANAARPLGARVSAVADLGAGTSGTAMRAQVVLEGETVTFRNATLARTRTAGGDVSLGTPRVSYAEGTGRGSVAIRAGEGEGAIGEVGAELKAGKVAMRWEEGVIERARLGKSALGPQDLASADHAAQAGRVTDAAKVYEAGLPASLSPANRLAREAIVDIARGRPAALSAKLDSLAADGKLLSSDAHAALEGALRRESAPVARRFEAAMNTGKPLNDAATKVVVERGHVSLTRDIAELPRASTPAPATDLSKGVVYVDSRLRVGQEGLLPDTGGTAARWTHQRGVKLVELRTGKIGELPDRFVETSTGLTVERAPGAVPVTRPGLPPPVFLLQKCDAGHQTATTSDDC
jgi:hypothetical protein